jgi:hypothetical protein
MNYRLEVIYNVVRLWVLSKSHPPNSKVERLKENKISHNINGQDEKE